MIETCYNDTTQRTTFWVFAETFIHTIYILQPQQPFHRLKMENFMWWCTNESTQTTMDTMLTTTFWIFDKTFMHKIYNLQREQPVYRCKAKTLISLFTNETTQKTIFSIDSKNFLTLKTTHTASLSWFHQQIHVLSATKILATLSIQNKIT